MSIIVVGLNHKTAPLEVRERVTLAKAALPSALKALGSILGQGVILCTCNRSEIYAYSRSAVYVKQFYATCHAVPLEEIEPFLYAYQDEDAVRHLFRVASGLDSLILGEDQILGQVREAYSAATREDVALGAISRLFHAALRVGKRARRETAIGRNALSVSRACVSLVKNILGPLEGRRVAIVGIGDAGKLTARALVDGGATEILVINRTYPAAQELAEQLGGQAVQFEQLPDVLAQTDIVVSCTGSPEFILDAHAVKSAMSRRQNKPMFLFDIAMPRDIDPQVTSIPGVYLRNIDDLEAVSQANRAERAREAEKVEVIVGEEVGRFMDWWRSLEIVPTIADLRRRAEGIRHAEVTRTLRKLPNLTEEDKDRIEALSQAIVKKLLHQPIASLKEGALPGTTQTVRELFDLDETDKTNRSNNGIAKNSHPR